MIRDKLKEFFKNKYINMKKFFLAGSAFSFFTLSQAKSLPTRLLEESNPDAIPPIDPKENILTYKGIIENFLQPAHVELARLMLMSSLVLPAYALGIPIPFMTAGYIGCLCYDVYARKKLGDLNSDLSEEELKKIKQRWIDSSRYAYYLGPIGSLIGFLPLVINYYSAKFYASSLNEGEKGNREMAGFITGLGYFGAGIILTRSIVFSLPLWAMGGWFGGVIWNNVEKVMLGEMDEQELKERLIADNKWGMIAPVGTMGSFFAAHVMDNMSQ